MKSGAEGHMNIIKEYYLRKKGSRKGKNRLREFLGIKPGDVVVIEVREKFLKIYKRMHAILLKRTEGRVMRALRKE